MQPVGSRWLLSSPNPPQAGWPVRPAWPQGPMVASSLQLGSASGTTSASPPSHQLSRKCLRTPGMILGCESSSRCTSVSRRRSRAATLPGTRTRRRRPRSRSRSPLPCRSGLGRLAPTAGPGPRSFALGATPGWYRRPPRGNITEEVFVACPTPSGRPAADPGPARNDDR